MEDQQVQDALIFPVLPILDPPIYEGIDRNQPEGGDLFDAELTAFENVAIEREERDIVQHPPRLPPLLLISADPSRNGHQTLPGNAIQAREVFYSPLIPEYPKTSTEGTVYVISIDGLNEDEIAHPWKTIQYNIRRKFPPKKTSSAFLGSAPCWKISYECTGGYCCELMDESWSHFEATQTIWDRLKQLREELEDYSARRAAYSWARSLRELFENGRSCRGFNTGTCRLVVEGFDHGVEMHPVQPQVHCSNSELLPNHFWKLLPSEFQQYYTDMISILQGEPVPPINETCYVMDTTRGRRQYCRVNHFDGPQRMVHRPCNVRYQFYTPIEGSTESILVVSHGMHNHAPIPPRKAPSQVISSINQVLRRINQRHLTLVPFLASPEVQQLCAQYGTQSLAQIHASLSNRDYLRLIIQKHQALHFPAGSSRASLWCLYQQQKGNPNQYVQFVADDGSRFIAICFFKEQVRLFKSGQVQTFQVDANYKHLAGRNSIEIIWAWWDVRVDQAIPLVRVYTNTEDADMYAFMYTKVFSIFKEKYGYHVQWRHMQPAIARQRHSLIGITVDQDARNLLGFGYYLHRTDPENRSYRWHLLRTIRLCKIHFSRGVEKLCGPYGGKSSPLYHRMMSLLVVQSEDAYMAVIQDLQNEPGLYDWATHKGRRLISAGLNQSCSRIPIADWNLLNSHTNQVEVLHNISYQWSGKFQPLRETAEANMQGDMDRLTANETCKELGIPLSFRDTTIFGRTKRGAEVEVRNRQSRRRRRLEPNHLHALPEEDNRLRSRDSSRATSRSSTRSALDNDGLSHFSSSGIPSQHQSSYGSSPSSNMQTPMPTDRSRRNITAEDRLLAVRERQLDITQRENELEQQRLDLEERRIALEERKLALEQQRQQLNQS